MKNKNNSEVLRSFVFQRRSSSASGSIITVCTLDVFTVHSIRNATTVCVGSYCTCFVGTYTCRTRSYRKHPAGTETQHPRAGPGEAGRGFYDSAWECCTGHTTPSLCVKLKLDGCVKSEAGRKARAHFFDQSQTRRSLSMASPANCSIRLDGAKSANRHILRSQHRSLVLFWPSQSALLRVGRLVGLFAPFCC